MTKERLLQLIEQGEGINIEFKSFENGISKNLYESICAFLNRNGGHIGYRGSDINGGYFLNDNLRV